MASRVTSRMAAAGILLWGLVGAGPAWAEGDPWFDEAESQPAEVEAEPEPVVVEDARPRPKALPTAEREVTTDDADPRALETFRPALEPYGTWVEHPRYGLVWVPDRRHAGERFTPYVTSGHWELDEAGEWIWVSELPFGPVVFHYGRWVWVSGTGWAWIPGYEYRGAWVSWRLSRAGYGFVGWAPTPPSYIWVGGSAVYIVHGHPHHYYYVPHRHVLHHHVHRHVVRDRAHARRITERTVRLPAAPRAVIRSRDIDGPGSPDLVERRAAPRRTAVSRAQSSPSATVRRPAASSVQSRPTAVPRRPAASAERSPSTVPRTTTTARPRVVQPAPSVGRVPVRRTYEPAPPPTRARRAAPAPRAAPRALPRSLPRASGRAPSSAGSRMPARVRQAPSRSRK